MQNNRKTELLVGLFLFVSLVMLVTMILQFGKVQDYFRGSYVTYVQFSDATGIRSGSPVALGGQRIGKVKSEPVLDKQTFTTVTIELEIFEQFHVPANSSYEIATSGLMGDAYIAIRPSALPPKIVKDGDGREVILGSTGSGLSALTKQAETISGKVDRVMDDIKGASSELKEALRRVNENALADDTLEDFRNSMSHLESTMKNVDQNILGGENAADLRKAISDVKDAAAAFKATSLTMQTTAEKLGPVLDRMSPAMDKLETSLTSADLTLKSFREGADNFASLTKTMAKGDGLFKALLTDPELRDDFKALVDNLRRHGLIWGYKDDFEEIKRREEQALPAQTPRKGIFSR
jgi:ABC-type transporter Mla subunit MlaD